jgi:hypothetical protein
MSTPDVGSFPIEATVGGAVSGLPNVSVAFPGEHWSDGKAAVAIDPGSMIVPIASGGKLYWNIAASGVVDPRAAIALRPVMVPDRNQGSQYYEPLGPNQIMNLVLHPHEYVHSYHSGAFQLTLVTPGAYLPSDLIGWDPAASRPTGKAQTNITGAWKKVTNAAYALFEVQEWRPVSTDGLEGILTVRSLRGQF